MPKLYPEPVTPAGRSAQALLRRLEEFARVDDTTSAREREARIVGLQHAVVTAYHLLEEQMATAQSCPPENRVSLNRQVAITGLRKSTVQNYVRRGRQRLGTGEAA